MNVFLARQPIFDQEMNVYAYELLYRSGDHSMLDDGNQMTGEVIYNTIINFGLDQVLNGRRAFVNFTKDTIVNDLPKLFSNDTLTVEILEDVKPDQEFIDQCSRLKSEGYTLALDDFVLDYEYEEIVDIVDIIKVDFLLTSRVERKQIVDKHKHRNIKFLAEKVESQEEFDEAVSMGYDYFQGYFFSKPVLVTGTEIKAFNATYALMLKELSEDEPNFDVLENIVKQDYSITFTLLKLVNSAAFYSRNRITSVKQALTMLGLKELRRWISFLMIKESAKDKPDELVRMSLIRGRMLESVLKRTVLKRRASEGFLLGLFSLIDVILNRKMEDLVLDLPLEADVIDALYEKEGIFNDILTVIKQYEKGVWFFQDSPLERLGMDLEIFADAYVESLEWVSKIE